MWTPHLTTEPVCATSRGTTRFPQPLFCIHSGTSFMSPPKEKWTEKYILGTYGLDPSEGCDLMPKDNLFWWAINDNTHSEILITAALSHDATLNLLPPPWCVSHLFRALGIYLFVLFLSFQIFLSLFLILLSLWCFFCGKHRGLRLCGWMWFNIKTSLKNVWLKPDNIAKRKKWVEKSS